MKGKEASKKRLLKAYALMLERYGPQHWWPSESQWETCAGAILTQNASWSNVSKAIARLKEAGCLEPEKMLSIPLSELEELIKPSGYFRLKARRLLELVRWWNGNVKNGRLKPEGLPLERWRESLLSVKGVGPETADSILLYAFNLPVFVVDAYTKRAMARHFGTPSNISYDALKAIFEEALPKDAAFFNELHALFVRAAVEDCRKSVCGLSCPLRRLR